MAWTAAEFDFHSIGLALTRLSDHYNMHSAKVSTAITLTLLLRPVGGMVFGFAGDLYGRKWPLIINLAILALLQLLSVFCDTFPDFVAVSCSFVAWFKGT